MKRVAILLVLAFAAYDGSRNDAWAGDLDGEGVPPAIGFVIADGHIGTIVKATDNSNIGKIITFTGLRGEKPKVIFEGSGTSPVTKVYESETTITLILVASGSGSVDAFVIDKKKGLFSRAFAGSFAGVYSGSAIGVLK